MRRLRPHHGVMIVSVALSVAAFVAAEVTYHHTKSGFALAAAVSVALGSVLTFGSVVAGRAMIASAGRAGHPRAEGLTGRVLGRETDPVTNARPLPSGGLAWTGGARLHAALGWVNASYGLGVLEVIPPKVTLRVTGGRLLGAPPVEVEPASDVRCYPVRGWMPGTRGIAIHRRRLPPPISGRPRWPRSCPPSRGSVSTCAGRSTGPSGGDRRLLR